MCVLGVCICTYMCAHIEQVFQCTYVCPLWVCVFCVSTCVFVFACMQVSYVQVFVSMRPCVCLYACAHIRWYLSW